MQFKKLFFVTLALALIFSLKYTWSYAGSYGLDSKEKIDRNTDSFGAVVSDYDKQVETEGLCFLVFVHSGDGLEKYVLVSTTQDPGGTGLIICRDAFSGLPLARIDDVKNMIIEQTNEPLQDASEYEFTGLISTYDYLMSYFQKKIDYMGYNDIISPFNKETLENIERKERYNVILKKLFSDYRHEYAYSIFRNDTETLEQLNGYLKQFEQNIQKQNSFRDYGAYDPNNDSLAYPIYDAAKIIMDKLPVESNPFEDEWHSMHQTLLPSGQTTLRDIELFYLSCVPLSSQYRKGLEVPPSPLDSRLSNFNEQTKKDSFTDGDFETIVKEAGEAKDYFGLTAQQKAGYRYKIHYAPDGKIRIAAYSDASMKSEIYGVDVEWCYAEFFLVNGTYRCFLTNHDGGYGRGRTNLYGELFSTGNGTLYWREVRDMFTNKGIYMESELNNDFIGSIRVYNPDYARFGLNDQCKSYRVPLKQLMEKGRDGLGNKVMTEEDIESLVWESINQTGPGIVRSTDGGTFYLSADGFENLYCKIIPKSSWYFGDYQTSASGADMPVELPQGNRRLVLDHFMGADNLNYLYRKTGKDTNTAYAMLVIADRIRFDGHVGIEFDNFVMDKYLRPIGVDHYKACVFAQIDLIVDKQKNAASYIIKELFTGVPLVKLWETGKVENGSIHSDWIINYTSVFMDFIEKKNIKMGDALNDYECDFIHISRPLQIEPASPFFSAANMFANVRTLNDLWYAHEQIPDAYQIDYEWYDSGFDINGPYVVSPGSTSLYRALRYSDGTEVEIEKWESSDAGIASIDASGKLTALNPNKTCMVQITAWPADKSKARQTIEVTVMPVPRVGRINMYHESRIIDKDDTVVIDLLLNDSAIKLDTIVYPAWSSPVVTWKSSNSKVAAVDETGKVTGLKKGTATITATAKDGSKKMAACKVNVTYLAKEIRITGPNTITSGKKVTLMATVLPEIAVNKKVRWYSFDTNIATVSSSGVVTAKKVTEEQTVTIRAFTDDGRASIDIVVIVKPK